MKFKSIYYYDSVDSTNRVLKDLARQGAPAGTCVLTSSQTAGRGRMGRAFYSPSGCGLYLSILYRPDNEVNLLAITMQASVNTAKCIEKICQVSPGIKWVNDLYLNQRKIAGILAEGMTVGNHLAAVILGIGINLWEPEEGYPPEIKNIAGSVFGRGKPDAQVRCALSESLIKNLFPLNHHPENIAYYREHSIVTGKEVILFDPKETLSGYVEGFTDNGELILKTDDGAHKIIHSGEISLRLKNTEIN